MVSVIFDGNNLAYRSNSVMELSTKDGRRTSAIFGVFNSIPHSVKTVEEELDVEVGEIVVVWDCGRNVRRTTLYPEYKGGRRQDQTEEDRIWYEEFIQQTNIIHENLPLLGVKSIKQKGQEADDLIYTWINRCRDLRQDDEENRFIIVSTDEDFLQLISEDTCVYSPIKKIMYTYDNFYDLFGIKPENFLTYKVVRGDDSDNISGIRGIGDATGKKLVNTFGNMDSIMRNRNHPDLVKSKVLSRLFTPEGLRTLDRNNKLINLTDYVDINETKDYIDDSIRVQPYVDDSSARKFLMDYQLSSILMKYKEWIRVFKSVNSIYFE